MSSFTNDFYNLIPNYNPKSKLNKEWNKKIRLEDQKKMMFKYQLLIDNIYIFNY